MSQPAEVRRLPARRRTELGLILLAVLLTGGLYVLASLGKAGSLPANIGPFLGIVCGLLLVAHLGMRRWAPNADPILLPTACLLNGIGYVFIARLNRHLAGLQAVWTAIGIGAFLLTLVVVRRARDLERYRYTFALLGIGLLLLPAGAGRRPEHQRRPALGPPRPGHLPAGRAGQDRAGHLLRLVHGRAGRAAVPGHLRLGPVPRPRPQVPGPGAGWRGACRC